MCRLVGHKLCVLRTLFKHKMKSYDETYELALSVFSGLG